METRASNRRKLIVQEENARKEMERDRISDTIRERSLDDLPEHLLIFILTFLPTFDAVRSCVLSRKWRNLWSSVPSLDFDHSLLPPTPNDPSVTCTRFASFIDQTLISRSRSPILKFRLQFDFTENFWDSHLDSWIRYAISHNAVELDIDFCDSCPYDFNFGFLKKSRVQDLRVSRCDLIFPVSSMKFTTIRSVYLAQIYLTDEMVVDLTSRCINLESLSIDYCHGMKRLRICSSTLKELSLEDFDPPSEEEEEEEMLEISCPNLRSVSISDFKMQKYCIKDSASLVEADVHFIIIDELRENYSYWSKVVRLFSGVKRLSVQNYWFELLCQNDASSNRFAFKNLNHLELMTGCKKRELLGLAALLKICPNISTLTLDFFMDSGEDNEWVPKELVNIPIEFSISNLKILNLKRWRGKKNEEELVSLTKKHGAALEKIVVWDKNGNISPFPLSKDLFSV